jgi:hypothetical protein
MDKLVHEKGIIIPSPVFWVAIPADTGKADVCKIFFAVQFVPGPGQNLSGH